MRRKFLKIFVFLFVFILSNIHNTYAVSNYYISNNTLTIKVDEKGDFTQLTNTNDFDDGFENIVIWGEMSAFDLVILQSISEKCKSIDLTNVNAKLLLSESFKDFYNLEKFKFPDNLICINSDILSNCPNLKYVTLPQSLQTIEYGAFQNCPNLKMEVPGNVKLHENVFDGSPGVKVLKGVEDLKNELPTKSSHTPFISCILSWIGL